MEESAKMLRDSGGLADNKRQKGVDNFKYLPPTRNKTALIKEEKYQLS